jgi:predicted nucleotidyltransferase
VFTTVERQRLRDRLVSAAHSDARVTGAAITGSAAVGREDQWSDIDLALCLSADADHDRVVDDWTGRMYADHAAVHHLDVHRDATLYRVFLLASTLQVDIAFWPAAEFGAIAPTFRLVFGTANERPAGPAPSAAELIGLAWLHALHARSSIARGRVWQSEYMISGVRDNVLALACLRHGTPARQGRGMDSLPPQATAVLAGALVRSLDLAELRRAFAVTTEALLAEVEHVDPGLSARLAGPLRELTD